VRDGVTEWEAFRDEEGGKDEDQRGENGMSGRGVHTLCGSEVNHLVSLKVLQVCEGRLSDGR
jgi:hypothetical protein